MTCPTCGRHMHELGQTGDARRFICPKDGEIRVSNSLQTLIAAGQIGLQDLVPEQRDGFRVYTSLKNRFEYCRKLRRYPKGRENRRKLLRLRGGARMPPRRPSRRAGSQLRRSVQPNEASTSSGLRRPNCTVGNGSLKPNSARTTTSSDVVEAMTSRSWSN